MPFLVQQKYLGCTLQLPTILDLTSLKKVLDKRKNVYRHRPYQND